MVGSFVLPCTVQSNSSKGLNRLKSPRDSTDMAVNPSRDQGPPGPSHSTRSYPEMGMGWPERVGRDGRETLDHFQGLWAS